MLEKPNLDEALILACLSHDFGITGYRIEFLPLGADRNTAVYAVHGGAEPAYFLKLRSGRFDENSVALPKFLSELGISQIILPLKTLSGELSANLDLYKLILYPFIEGKNAYQVPLPQEQWTGFGTAVKQVHAAQPPAEILARLPQEAYAPEGRDTVRTFLDRVKVDSYSDRVAAQLAQVLLDRQRLIHDLVNRAELLAGILHREPRPFILCHCDLHAGNLHIPEIGQFYIVDWDDPLLAPKEHDLMFIGGGLLGPWQTPAEEEAWFYQGYGPTRIDSTALAYYRYERIIQDIAVYCQQILINDDGGVDREQSLRYLESNFLPGGTVELAYISDRTGLFSHS